MSIVCLGADSWHEQELLRTASFYWFPSYFSVHADHALREHTVHPFLSVPGRRVHKAYLSVHSPNTSLARFPRGNSNCCGRRRRRRVRRSLRRHQYEF